MLPGESVSTATFSFNCFIKFLFNSRQKGVIEALASCTGYIQYILYSLWYRVCFQIPDTT